MAPEIKEINEGINKFIDQYELSYKYDIPTAQEFILKSATQLDKLEKEKDVIQNHFNNIAGT